MAAPDLTSQAALGSTGAPPACHLARVQLRRYMAGDEIPEPLLDELRRHIGECDGCKAESVRLRDALASVVPGSSPAPGIQPAESGASPIGKLLALLPAIPDGRLKSALKAPKTVGMSIALAIVVVLLTTVFRNPTASLGPKAAETVAASEEESGETKASAADKSAHSEEGGKATTEEVEGDAHATEDDPGAEEGHGSDSEAGHDLAAESADEPETEAFAPLRGTVVVAGGTEHGTGHGKPSAPSAKPAAKPRPATRRKAAPPARPASPKPATQAAITPKPSNTAEPYVKVYK